MKDINIEELKNEFIELVKPIKREGILNLLDWLTNKSDFFTSTCSTKYHNNFEGGLLDHSIKVYRLMKEKCDIWRTKNSSLFIPDDDSIKIQSLFHDISKANFYKIGYRNVKDDNGQWNKKEVYEVNDKFPITSHSLKSVIILQNFIKLKTYEILSINLHMGIPESYSESIAFHSALDMYPYMILLHTSDFESSVLLEEVIK